MEINLKVVKMGGIVRDINTLFQEAVERIHEYKYRNEIAWNYGGRADAEIEYFYKNYVYVDKQNNKNFGLLLIFNYKNLNQLGKTILSESETCFSGCEDLFKSFDLNSFNELDEEKLNALAMDFISTSNYDSKFPKTFDEYLVMEFMSYFNRYHRCIYIFWSLMILAVDKSNAEKHLSSICDFAQVFHFSKEKLEYIANVVKVVFEGHLDDFNPNLDEKYRNLEDLDVFNEILIKYGNYNFK